MLSDSEDSLSDDSTHSVNSVNSVNSAHSVHSVNSVHSVHFAVENLATSSQVNDNRDTDDIDFEGSSESLQSLADNQRVGWCPRNRHSYGQGQRDSVACQHDFDAHCIIQVASMVLLLRAHLNIQGTELEEVVSDVDVDVAVRPIPRTHNMTCLRVFPWVQRPLDPPNH